MSIIRYDTTSLQTCTVNENFTDNHCKFPGICIQGHICPVKQTDFLAFLRSECKHEKWAYQNITIVSNISQLATVLTSGELRAVCDGSFDVGYGPSGWCIDGVSFILRGVNIVPIGSDSLDANRCELAGTYTLLRIAECKS